jgi:hypothetical protein
LDTLQAISLTRRYKEQTDFASQPNQVKLAPRAIHRQALTLVDTKAGPSEQISPSPQLMSPTTLPMSPTYDTTKSSFFNILSPVKIGRLSEIKQKQQNAEKPSLEIKANGMSRQVSKASPDNIKSEGVLQKILLG